MPGLAETDGRTPAGIMSGQSPSCQVPPKYPPWHALQPLLAPTMEGRARHRRDGQSVGLDLLRVENHGKIDESHICLPVWSYIQYLRKGAREIPSQCRSRPQCYAVTMDTIPSTSQSPLATSLGRYLGSPRRYNLTLPESYRLVGSWGLTPAGSKVTLGTAVTIQRLIVPNLAFHARHKDGHHSDLRLSPTPLGAHTRASNIHLYRAGQISPSR